MKGLTNWVESGNSLSITQFEILKYLTEYLTISEIAKHRRTSRTAVYKVIQKLIKQNRIRKVDSNYRLTDYGRGGLHGFIGLRGKIRLHNLSIKVQILNKPRNWELKRSKIALIRVLSKNVDLKNNSYQIHCFSNIKVKTTTNSIIFNLPSTYGKTPSEALEKALEMFWKSISKVERLFNVILIKDRKLNIEIISNHYSKLNDDLAKIYKKEGKKLYIKDKEGKTWLIADYSFNVDELETIDNIKAHEDMEEVMQPFLNDLRKDPTTFSEVREIMNGIQSNQLMFAENMKSHVEAIRELSKGVKEFRKEVGKVYRKQRGKLNFQTKLDYFGGLKN